MTERPPSPCLSPTPSPSPSPSSSPTPPSPSSPLLSSRPLSPSLQQSPSHPPSSRLSPTPPLPSPSSDGSRVPKIGNNFLRSISSLSPKKVHIPTNLSPKKKKLFPSPQTYTDNTFSSSASSTFSASALSSRSDTERAKGVSLTNMSISPKFLSRDHPSSPSHPPSSSSLPSTSLTSSTSESQTPFKKLKGSRGPLLIGAHAPIYPSRDNALETMEEGIRLDDFANTKAVDRKKDKRKSEVLGRKMSKVRVCVCPCVCTTCVLSSYLHQKFYLNVNVLLHRK